MITNWENPEYTDYPILDGVQLSALWPDIQETPIGSSVALARMGDGTGVVIRKLYTEEDPESHCFMEWSINDEALDEGDWRKIDKVIAKSQPVYFIPGRTISVSYICNVDGVNTFTLKRPIASFTYPSFDNSLNPPYADIDDVEVDVIFTGTPASGEILIENTTITTASDLTIGQILYLRYYPSFQIWLTEISRSNPQFGLLTRAVLLTEV